MSEYIEYALFRFLSFCARFLSFHAAGTIGAFFGDVAFFCTGFRKAVTFDNLTHAFPEKSHPELRSIARGAYRNYGTAIVEMLWAGGAGESELRKAVTLRNGEVIHDALAMGKGVILLGGHFGSWELLVSSVRLIVGVPFTVIVQHQRNARIDHLVDSTRRRFGNVTVPMGPSVREVLKALQQSRVVAMLGDQSGAKEAIFVNFFGRPAATHRGAAAFSLKTGAPIIMIFLIRQPDSTYRADIEALDGAGIDGYTENNILELTRRHAALLEKYIRLYPDHWLWMHKRWKHTGYFEAHREHLAPHAAAGESGQ